MKVYHKKRICFLTNSLNTSQGGGRFSLGLIDNIKKTNIFNIDILTTVSSGHDLEKPILYSSKIKLILSFFKIRKIFKKCDIIHAIDGFPYGVIAVIASLGLRKKIIISTVGSGSIKPLYKFYQGFLLRFAYRLSNVITTISSYTSSEIKKKVPRLDMQIITPGIDYSYFYNANLQDEYNQEIELYKPYILSVAKLKPRKGHYFSLSVFAKVADELPHIKYLIVGSGRGKYYKEIKQLIQNLKIEDKVIFKQNISDEELVLLYKNAEMFILLPQNDNHDIEGFGLVYIEAAAFGLPVIGCFDSGAEDAILNKQNGFLVNPDDVDNATEKVLEIMNNSSLKLEFSRKSVDFAKKNDWGYVIKYYLEIYKNL